VLYALAFWKSSDRVGALVMQCRERTALLKIYRERVRAFSNAVESLKKDRAALSPGEFMQRWNFADFAREACSVAQRRVCSHVAVHGCTFDTNDTTQRMVA